LTIFYRFLAVFFLVGMLALPIGVQAYEPRNTAAVILAQRKDAFQPARCMFDLPIGAVEGEDVQCGYLTVPEEHINPDGPTIQLAVAIIKSKDLQPKPDPLVLAQGGPGGSTIDTYAPALLGNNNIRKDRDIILFDQRGTLYSKPALYCDEIDQITIDTLDQNLTIDESERLYREALSKCYDRLTGKGINPSAFDSIENAADIESLRQALGYPQINLYGVSYGTLLALHAMGMFPSSLRSVILDGVVPPQTNFLVNVAQTENRSFSRLFDTCKTDPACNRSFPELEKTFFEVVDRLNKQPAHIQLTDPQNGNVYDNVVLNGDSFLSGVFQFLYSGDLVKALPRIIYDAKEGDFDVFARIFSIFALDHTTS
jgi:pimeloyl-ACP methyl ester carboxylesterase